MGTLAKPDVSALLVALALLNTTPIVEYKIAREALKATAAIGWQLCAGTQKPSHHSDALMGVAAGLRFEAVVALVRRTMCVDIDKKVRTDWFHSINETFIKKLLLGYWDLGKADTFTIDWWADFCDPLLRAKNTIAFIRSDRCAPDVHAVSWPTTTRCASHVRSCANYSLSSATPV